jgi:hypothetical protein
MKDLFEIATGKRFRKNRLLESINGPAVERFRMMNGSKAERSLPLALITVMPEVTYKILETGLCGQKAADSNLVDLTTLLACLIPENTCNADSNFAASNKISPARMHAKADEVYPRNATVNAAITRHKTNQGLFVRVAGDDALLIGRSSAGMSSTLFLEYLTFKRSIRTCLKSRSTASLSTGALRMALTISRTCTRLCGTIPT